MKLDFFTINGLSNRLRTDRRTLVKVLSSVPPDKVKNGLSYYSIKTAEQALAEWRKKPMAAKSKLECQLLEQKIRTATRENDEEEGRLVRAAEVQATQYMAGLTLKNWLQNRLERELPQKLIGLDYQAILKLMQQTVDDCCRRMQNFDQLDLETLKIVLDNQMAKEQPELYEQTQDLKTNDTETEKRDCTPQTGDAQNRE